MRLLQIFSPRKAAARRVKPGGFNLLPYRERDRRLARRRCALEWSGAAVAGAVVALMLAGWYAYEGMRFDAQRASVERSLAQLAAPLAEHAALLHDAREREARDAQAVISSASLTHLLDLMAVLGEDDTPDSDGVVMQEIRHRPHETEFRAMAVNHVAPAAWLKRLTTVPGAEDVEMKELHRTLPGNGQITSQATRDAVEFGAHVRWAGGLRDTKSGTSSANVQTNKTGGER
ncbi:fimbrial assembly protein [Paraburkholderia saeva]|uniref:Fimbrial assembly protein n=1 Tax=Paraburkholderia saeva TaxID=2777537 RepID=A0A9N8S193_9BURK|nr:fimbrial assembly protein [Paraburkholderia saeva]CAG4916695.1 hypothetical protein R70241_04473 [Paraburkholderia saeva]CAG4918361.1 hypothetical protein R52603_04642 [Paraburkholderia saeva]CAG4919878.1 hypothetical protein LMG31841_04924 [Paraburkholderia saeva]